MEIGTVVVRRNGKGWGVCAGAGVGWVCGWVGVFTRAREGRRGREWDLKIILEIPTCVILQAPSTEVFGVKDDHRGTTQNTTPAAQGPPDRQGGSGPVGQQKCSPTPT